RLYDWGTKSRPSAASAFIIGEAHRIKDGKLTVVALGALTNVASAIMEDPTIVPKIELHWLGSGYNFEKQTMSNLDFNSLMDMQALYVILNSPVELHIIPNNEASRMKMSWAETTDRFKGKHDLLDFILLRWFNHLDGGRDTRTIWDLALIEAIIHKDLSTKMQVRTSKEKGDRDVWMYTEINDEKMREDFYRTTLDYLEKLK
ncbi:nucleoside hydrolase, partial [Aquiflexum sp.]|uniref:nucleoside hydrolase n=1 Tax=Aquiflexum sp. TaxID=1872584 RepID=UPI0035935EB0